MAYQGQLSGGQSIVLENDGDQTVIRLSSDGQRQSSSATTGQWTQAPTLFQTDGGAVVEVRTAGGSVFYGVGGGQLHSLDRKPDLDGVSQIDLKPVEDGAGKSDMTPMKPMKPMRPM